MPDWNAFAKAVGLNLPAAELEEIVPPLDALEETLRPFVSDLPPDLEPATNFTAEESE